MLQKDMPDGDENIVDEEEEFYFDSDKDGDVKLDKKNIDGLPKFDKSTQEQLPGETKIIKNRHIKQQSVMAYQTRQENDLKSIRQKYKHKRMESKNALVNHYRSLSLMQEDDMPKPSLKLDLGQKEDFDDISSIYTAKENQLDTLRKRINAREKRLSMMNEGDLGDISKMKEELELMNAIEGKKMDDEQLQQKLDHLDEIKEELKEE